MISIPRSPGSDDAKQSVQICAISINQAASFVNDADDLKNIGLEKPQRVGIGEHQPRCGFIAGGSQRFQINITVFIGGDGDDLESLHCRTGRIGAVGGIGDKDLCSFFILSGVVISADDCNTDKLTLRTGCGLQGDPFESADLCQP